MEKEIKRYEMYINGEFVKSSSEKYIESINPATNKVWAEIPDGNEEDVNNAVHAARACFESNEWRDISPTKRGRLLRKLADLLLDNAEYLAEIETKDNGKLYKEMVSQTKVIPSWFEYYAGLADKMEGSVIPVDNQSIFNYTLREPLGVVAALTPWNSPLFLTVFKLAPAIASGNTVVVKPSEYTSSSMIEFARIFDKVGFPPGVLNVVTGYGKTIGEPLTKHKSVSKVAFTGGTETGRIVGMNAMSHFAPVTLELGGKSPNIVFDDADFEAAESGVISGIFAASGQTCIAGSRLFVQDTIVEEFVKRLVKRTNNIKLGDPFDSETQMGPAATPEQLSKIERYVTIAREEGAKVLTGGERYKTSSKGLFYKPTILTNVTNESRIAQEEVFGPVLSVIPFSNEGEVVKMANDSDFGLGAGVWTNNIKRAHRIARKLNSGIVWINTYRALTFNSPFGGYKDSGLGRENGIEAMFEYTQTKSVWVELSEEINDPFSIKV